MENQTSPIDTNEDGLLYWPIKAPDTGTLVGWPLPNVGSKQWKVLRAATRKRGGNLQMFYRCGADWEKTLDEVTRRFDLEIVMIQDGLPVTEITGETHLFLRPRP